MQTKHWLSCPTCKLITFSKDLTRHKCPAKIKAKIDAEVDMLADEMLMTWDEDVREFWNSNDVKFFEWDLKRKNE